MEERFEIHQAGYWQLIPDGRLQVVLRNGEIHYFSGEEIEPMVARLREAEIRTADDTEGPTLAPPWKK